MATESRLNGDQQFEFSGGWLCLDFCNTADGDVNQSWTETLNSYTDLVTWSREAGSLSEEDAVALLALSVHDSELAETVYQEAIRLRGTLYGIFAAVAHEQSVDPADLNALNDALKTALVHLQVHPTAEGFEYVWDSAEDPLWRPLWPVIRSASELLTAQDKLHLVRECGGQECSWLFLDTSRNHSRRWCDMKGCGNRAKARRYYQRNKSDA